MTTFSITNDPVKNIPREVQVNLSQLGINYKINLMNEDGSVYFPGAGSNFNLINANKPNQTESQVAALAALKATVEEAFETYYLAAGL